MGKLLHEMKIGSLKLRNPYLLAPMLEPNDIAFRLLCKKAGCALTYTGMTSPLTKKKLSLDDKPALQIFASSSKGIKSFIKKYDKKVSLWDLNLGCPSTMSGKLKHGAFMQDLKTIEKILKVMRKSTKKPITVKIRKTSIALDIALLAEKYVDGVAIHSRTITQGYSGEPDYDFAIQIKKSVKIPVIYSGNINEKNAQKILQDFDFVFVGREAIGRPEIFSKLNNKNKLSNFSEYFKLAKKYKLPFRQIKYQAMNFSKGQADAKKIRAGIARIKNLEELKKFLIDNK